jgi:hypothetical protein
LFCDDEKSSSSLTSFQLHKECKLHIENPTSYSCCIVNSHHSIFLLVINSAQRKPFLDPSIRVVTLKHLA